MLFRSRVRLGFSPQGPELALVRPGLRAELALTVGRDMEVELTTINDGPEPLAFEDALHTYFALAGLDETRVEGLHDCPYIDKMDGKRTKVQDGAIHFTSETDRVYLDRGAATEIADPAAKRRIRVAKSGSASTVVWNPWIDKSKAMPDFGDEEWRGMCCVETANVGADRIHLLPGTQHTTRLRVSLA